MKMPPQFIVQTGSYFSCRLFCSILQGLIFSPCVILHSSPFHPESCKNFENFLISIRVPFSCSLLFYRCIPFSLGFFYCAGVLGGTKYPHIVSYLFFQPETFYCLPNCLNCQPQHKTTSITQVHSYTFFLELICYSELLIYSIANKSFLNNLTLQYNFQPPNYPPSIILS